MEELPMSNIAIEVKFDRATITYKPYDWISGSVRVFNPFGDKLQKFTNYGLKLKAEGLLTAQNKSTNKTLEVISLILNPLYLFKHESVVCTADITQENNTFPFKFKLVPEQGEELLETYVGVYVSISYEINVELNLSNQPMIKTAVPFFVQCPGQGKSMVKENFVIPRPAPIEMYPEKLLPNIQNKNVPRFKISGQMESDICNFSDDIKGYFLIQECDGKIRTIDLQLIRVEKIENRLGKFSEATEIQLIQVGDGNLSRRIEIPLFMIFPVYFSCPNFSYKDYSVEFELNFIMILYDGFKITMNFPLNILRL